MVNLAGTVLLLAPFSLFLLIIAWDYVAVSWASHEGSREAGGLPLVWLLKSLMLVLPLLLLLQSWSTAAACIRALRATPPDSSAYASGDGPDAGPA